MLHIIEMNHEYFTGDTIAKQTYGRGFGEPMTCEAGEEKDAGLCYPSCRSGFRGVGPVCWADSAPEGYPLRCNDVAWGKDAAACKANNDFFIKIGVWASSQLLICISAIFFPPMVSLCQDFSIQAVGAIAEAAREGGIMDICP
jgi:hypothetical protein